MKLEGLQEPQTCPGSVSPFLGWGRRVCLAAEGCQRGHVTLSRRGPGTAPRSALVPLGLCRQHVHPQLCLSGRAKPREPAEPRSPASSATWGWLRCEARTRKKPVIHLTHTSAHWSPKAWLGPRPVVQLAGTHPYWDADHAGDSLAPEAPGEGAAELLMLAHGQRQTVRSCSGLMTTTKRAASHPKETPQPPKSPGGLRGRESRSSQRFPTSGDRNSCHLLGIGMGALCGEAARRG